MVAFFAISPHAKKGTLGSFGDVIRFPWEVEPPEVLTETEQLSEEDWAKLEAHIRKMHYGDTFSG